MLRLTLTDYHAMNECTCVQHAEGTITQKDCPVHGIYTTVTIPEPFECEHYAMGRWYSIRTRDSSWLAEQSSLGKIRVKKLRREDFESVGFKLIKEKVYENGPDTYSRKLNGLLYIISHYPKSEKLALEVMTKKDNFRASCKTINELKPILKLYGLL